MSVISTTNRSSAGRVGNLTAAAQQILREEGIKSDYATATAGALHFRGSQTNRDFSITGLDALSQFERLLEGIDSSPQIENFLRAAFGTSQGTKSTRELYRDFLLTLQPQDGENPSSEPEPFIDFYFGGDAPSGIVEPGRLQAPLAQEMSYEGTKPVERLNYLILRNNALDNGNINADLLSVWFRGIPGTALSLAQPYVRMTILQPESGVNGMVPSMSWDFSLSGPMQPTAPISYRVGNDGAPLFRGSSRSSNNLNPTDRVYEILPDVFNAPQTYLANKSRVLDPAVPLLGLLNFSVTVDPSGLEFTVNQRASIALKLFDRSRLKDVSALVSPALRGRVAIKVDWGWKCDIAESVHNPYTRLLDNLNRTEYFSISTSSFSFSDDDSVNIDVRLHARAVDVIERLDVHVGALNNSSELLSNMQDQITQLAEELFQIVASDTSSGDLAVNLTSGTFLGRFTSAEDIINVRDGDPLIREIRDFIDANHPDSSVRAQSRSAGSGTGSFSAPTPTPNPRVLRAVEILRTLFGEYTPEDRENRWVVRQGSGQQVRTSTPSGSSSSSRGASISIPNLPIDIPTRSAQDSLTRLVEQPLRSSDYRERIVQLAFQYNGTRETGNNRGADVDAFIESVGRSGSAEWCMAFAHYIAKNASPTLSTDCPRTASTSRAWAAAVLNYSRDRWAIPEEAARNQTNLTGWIAIWARVPDDVLGARNELRTILGHAGVVVNVDWANGSMITVEGNTSPGRNFNARGSGAWVKAHRVLEDRRLVGFFKPNVMPSGTPPLRADGDSLVAAGFYDYRQRVGAFAGVPRYDDSSEPSRTEVAVGTSRTNLIGPQGEIG